jgi:WD40 repeat protein
VGGKEGLLHRIEKGHDQAIFSMDWNPAGQILATTGNDCRVVLWGKHKAYD